MAKKKKNLSRPVFIALITLITLAIASYYISDFFYKPAFVHYKEFGIDLPAKYSIHGIDVSKYQNEISWEDVKQMQVKKIKINFAFIKATEGLGTIDNSFRRNWLNAQKAGIPRGAYHFFISSRSGKAQAENFIETVHLQRGDLPPVLDIEQTNGASISDIQQRVSDWLQVVEKKYKVKPVIYTNADFYRIFLSGRFDDYPLWVAHYLVKDKPRISRSWTFWQHNESGHVNGINSFVDFNVFNGDSTAFEKMLIH
jgi:lysozyme